MQQVVPELGDPRPDLTGGPALDAVLQLVDLVVDRIDEIEEVLRDQVDHAVDHLAGARHVRDADRFLRRARVERMPAFRGLSHGHELLARRDDVDLLVEDAVFLADADRDEEDAEDVVVVSLEARSRLVIVDCRLEKLLERPLVDLPRERVVQGLLVRIEQVDPLGHAPSLVLRSAGASPREGRRVRWPDGPRVPRASARRRARPYSRSRPP